MATLVTLTIDPSISSDWSLVCGYLSLKLLAKLFSKYITPNTPIAFTCLSSAQLLSSWLMNPNDISPYYLKSQNKRFEIFNDCESFFKNMFNLFC